MIDDSIEQRSLDWHRARLGKFTGSQVGNLMAASRDKTKVFGKTAESYLREVASERMLNPRVVENDEAFTLYLDSKKVSTKAMRWGQENEGAARDQYVEATGNMVHEVSSCRHNTIPNFAASPDAIIYNRDGKPFRSLEIKCPKASTFVEYLDIVDGASLKAIQPMYYWQVMAEMECTESVSADFVVYCPFLDSPLHIAHIERDEEAIAKLNERVLLANEYLKQKYNV